MTNFSPEDFQKICDDFKLISEAFTVVVDAKEKDSELFNLTMDLMKRELDRLFLDLNQIYENCHKENK